MRGLHVCAGLTLIVALGYIGVSWAAAGAGLCLLAVITLLLVCGSIRAYEAFPRRNVSLIRAAIAPAKRRAVNARGQHLSRAATERAGGARTPATAGKEAGGATPGPSA